MTFNDIQNAELRAWNRCSVIFNISKDKTIKEAVAYAAQFTQEAKDDISNMFNAIKKDGYEFTKARVSRLAQTLPRDEEEKVEDNGQAN